MLYCCIHSPYFLETRRGSSASRQMYYYVILYYIILYYIIFNYVIIACNIVTLYYICVYVGIYVYMYICVYIIWERSAVEIHLLAHFMLTYSVSPRRDATFQQLCCFIVGKHNFWQQAFRLGHIHVFKFVRCFAMAKQYLQHAHVNQKGSMGSQKP